MSELPLDFVRCVSCGHVYNRSFECENVPYAEKPNLMFNQGALWKVHLEHISECLLARLPGRPTVVEIGCGDGHLLRALADRNPDGRYLGYDLNGGIALAGGAVEARPMRFDPRRHIRAHRPDLVICRHMLEHMNDPLGFVQHLDFAVAWEGLSTRLFLEVPCIDRVLEAPRTTDFFYEHNSHFTTESFTRLLSRSTAEVDFVERGYDGEVVYGMARLGSKRERIERATRALRFRQESCESEARVRAQLDDLARRGLRIAIWGGTGKAAAFVNRNGLDADRFPLVVDSDPAKVGTHVPGMGQRIEAPEILTREPVDVLLIATQWRARDIVLEAEGLGLTPRQWLLEDRGRLVDYFRDPHPYRGASRAPEVAPR